MEHIKRGNKNSSQQTTTKNKSVNEGCMKYNRKKKVLTKLEKKGRIADR